jgi:hypothetical protein
MVHRRDLLATYQDCEPGGSAAAAGAPAAPQSLCVYLLHGTGATAAFAVPTQTVNAAWLSL